MNVVWALFCKRAEIEPETSQLTIYSEFDAIMVEAFPYHAPPFALVARFRFASTDDKAMGDLAIRIYSPADDILFESVVESRRKTERMIYDLQEQVFSSPGDYTFHIVVDDQDVHTLTLRLLDGEEIW